MNLFQKSLCTALILSAASLTAQAQATLKFKDQTTITGQVLRYDGTTQTVYFRSDDGRDMTITIDQLDGRSVYQLNRSSVSNDDAAGQLELANFARDVGLYAHSARHYRNARRLDPDLRDEVDAQSAIMREMAATHCMTMAKDAIKAGDQRGAERWLTRLIQRLPDEPLAKQAAEMLDGLYEAVHGARDDEIEAAAPDLLKTDLRRGKQLYDSMLDNNKRGLQARSGSQSRRRFNDAISDGERALREIDRVAKLRTDDVSQSALTGYRALVIKQMVETHLNLASQFTIQTSHNRALQEVNKALVLDSSNQAALAMRARVEAAINRNVGWW